MIRLEQNYRSTETILTAANALIAHNEARLGKTLWTQGGAGELISVYAAFNEQEEALFVMERLRQWIEQGHRRSEAAILYRSNAQSRQFEEKLVAMGIPYRVYGGLRFFERAEIKDALAYLRLIANPADDASFERVINTPVRGIGAKTMDMIRDTARAERCALWAAAEQLCSHAELPARARNPLSVFLDLIHRLREDSAELALWEQVQRVISRSGLLDHYRKEKGDQAEARLENLDELVNAARQFEYEPGEEEISKLDQFLAHAALESGDNQGDMFQDCVQLMTLHSAKGLEFDLVFIVGLEEGLFPSLQSMEDPGRLEEERRLCYVGITRARNKLYLTHAECRRLYGKENYPRPSRFIREIPTDCLEEIRVKGTIRRPVTPLTTPHTSRPDDSGLRLGQRVRHGKFGEGVILQQEGDGAQARVQVNFAEVGSKWLMLAYANLKPL